MESIFKMHKQEVLYLSRDRIWWMKIKYFSEGVYMCTVYMHVYMCENVHVYCVYACIHVWTHTEVNITLKLERESNIPSSLKQKNKISWIIPGKIGHGHTCNPSIWEANAERWQFGGHSEIHSKTLSQRTEKKKIKVIQWNKQSEKNKANYLCVVVPPLSPYFPPSSFVCTRTLSKGG